MSTSITVPETLDDLRGSWTIDPSHTRVGFVARHAMVTKVRGAFNDFTGTAVVGSGGIEDTRIELTIQVSSIDTRNDERDAHLRSGDFLQAEKYPTIRFVSKRVAAEGNTLEVTGDLTIKGITREVRIPFAFEGASLDPYGFLRAGFEGSTTIQRSEFGVSFNAVLETGGVLVSDKVTLEFEVSAVREG